MDSLHSIMAEDITELRKSESDEYNYDNSSHESEDKNVSQSNGNAESDEEGFEYDGELPLEVITTISKDMQTPVLKVKSNGVLTHRNIFTDTERAVLKDIVINYQDIVDTRSRSRDTFVEKQKVWQKIVVDYNHHPGMQQRTVKELRKCWDNMKYRARQAEKDIQQKSIKQEQGFHHMLNFGDVSITQDGISLVNGNGSLESTASNGFNAVINSSTTSESSPTASTPNFQEDAEALCMAKDLEAAEPALKKARQDAPKLSSLLMAHSGNSVSNNSVLVNQKTTEDAFCSKITDSVLAAAQPAVEVKEDIDCISSSTSCATKVKNISLNCLSVPSKGHQHPNFSKISKQSVSVQSVFSPKNLTTFHLGSGMTITSQSPNPPKIEQLARQASMRPMPTLKKMGVKHHESHCKKVKSKKKHSHSCISSTNELEEFPNSFGDVSDSFECKKLYTKLISQRLVQERREHEAKMLLLKRELSVYDQQSLYWSRKLQMLKAGRDSQDHPLTNGDGHI